MTDLASVTTTEPHDHRAASNTRLVTGAGLAFVASVIAQNAIRSAAPSANASSAKVIDYFAGHRGAEWALVGVFVVGAIGLTTFLGALWSRLVELSRPARAWGLTGVLGAVGILALFPMMVACEVGLLVSARRADLAGAVPVLWLLHNAVFAVLTLFIGIALFGLGRASVEAGVISSRVGRVTGVGAMLLAVNTVLAPIVADHGSPVMVIGLVGFLGWLVFVVAASLGLGARPLTSSSSTAGR